MLKYRDLKNILIGLDNYEKQQNKYNMYEILISLLTQNLVLFEIIKITVTIFKQFDYHKRELMKQCYSHHDRIKDLITRIALFRLFIQDKKNEVFEY